MEPWAALTAGLIGGVIFPVLSRLLTRIHIDDPLEAAAMHGGCGNVGADRHGLLRGEGGHERGVLPCAVR
jgi:Amt family ammonium transporter